jgi:DhnA family fructose-bisphosphate aldolase class Ia
MSKVRKNRMSSIAQRMNHIFGQDKKTFILAMDHGANFKVLPALKDIGKVIRETAAAGADAFLSTVGMADKFGECFLGKGIILRLDGGVGPRPLDRTPGMLLRRMLLREADRRTLGSSLHQSPGT